MHVHGSVMGDKWDKQGKWDKWDKWDPHVWPGASDGGQRRQRGPRRQRGDPVGV